MEIFCLSNVIVRLRVVSKTVMVTPQRRSSSESSEEMVFVPLVVVWIGQFCLDVIGRQNVKVALIDPWLVVTANNTK